MKMARRICGLLLALTLMVTGMGLSGLQAYAETTQTATPITSIKYDVTVAGSENGGSFNWITVSTENGWGQTSTTVPVASGGETSFTVSFSSAEGLFNLGYIETIWGSSMTVTVNKITVNGTYELTYGTAPVLQAGSGSANGLQNIWSGLSAGQVICSGANGYLALSEDSSKIVFYVQDGSGGDDEEPVEPSTASLQYVEAMGHGWNLGNSFDSVDPNLDTEDLGEESWSNPVVTRALIQAVKAKGFDSIRIPMTVYRRYTVNENAAEGEYKYVIDAQWLARYKQVVDYAVDEGLYVMINIHHDSWLWLSGWDGNTSSEEYRMFTDFWKQLAYCFKDEPARVCFETINEPTFEATGSISAQDKLDAVNLAAYNIIRGVSGNETRMIVMPTMVTNHEQGGPLYSLISSLDDDYIIATVHYYSEWVYSANLGKTGFDEVLWDEDYTARVSADNLMTTINNQFMENGIGVIIGEYGLLGYDTSETCLQTGEEIKYYEYMNELARQYKVCLMFWDNGSGIDRYDFHWKKENVGEILEVSMEGRSSYATNLDTLYYSSEATEDTVIPLTLNGNTFVGIEGLTEGTDYTYDAAAAAVTLKKEYINARFANAGTYGTFAELVMKFNSGADWHQYLVKFGTPTAVAASGTKSGITIPVVFNGSQVRRIMTYQASGKVGPNSDWWNYLQYDGSFSVDYENGSISFLSALFSDSTVQDGLLMAKVEFYDGQIVNIWMNVAGNVVTSSPDMAQETGSIDASSVICLYAGETEIPAQYIYAPEGTSVYGTWVEDDSIVTLSGWPSQMTFDTVAHDNFTIGGIVLYYMDVEKYVNASIGIKDAPSVENLSLNTGESKKITVSNLSTDAVVSYQSDNEAVAAVAADGTVTGISGGSAVITVTVSQYNRTDSFQGTVNVTAD